MTLLSLLARLIPGRTQFCQCGHERAAHKHYRRGSDCALCDCPGYRPGV